MKTKLCLLLLFLSTLFHFTVTRPVQALAKFSTNYQVNYTVYPSGVTHVKFLINQVNNLSVVYATEFSLSVNHTRLENIRVADENASLVPNVIRTRNGSIISFSFLNKVVGKDKKHFFTIEYDTTDVTTKVGNTWEINIPKLEPDENTVDHNIILTLPLNFPQPAFIDPKPSAIVNNNYYFSGKSLGNKHISAVFGQEQYYRVILDYHLQNNTKKKSIQKIALPPDTNYQKVLIEKIDPRPEKFETDIDGNWLATYTVDPDEKLDIKANLAIKVSFLPATKNNSHPEAFLQSNNIWDYDNPIFTIPDIQSLRTPKAIYDFVVDKFTYDFNKVSKLKTQKLSASESLKQPESAICSDFTNTFIAISRKAGIPARELQGFALSENPDLKPLSLKQDVLHSWPEFFDSEKNTWVQIDPTWAKTTQGIDYFNKLDFNHIVFVIHGTDPNMPITAGGYKNGDNQNKDVSVEPISEMEFPSAQIAIGEIKQTDGVVSIELKNNNPVGFFGSINIEKNQYISDNTNQVTIAPFSSEPLRIGVNHRPFLNKRLVTTIISINGARSEQRIQIEPLFSPVPLFSGIGGLFVAGTFLTRRLYLRRRQRKTTLHR